MHDSTYNSTPEHKIHRDIFDKICVRSIYWKPQNIAKRNYKDKLFTGWKKMAICVIKKRNNVQNYHLQ